MVAFDYFVWGEGRDGMRRTAMSNLSMSMGGIHRGGVVAKIGDVRVDKIGRACSGEDRVQVHEEKAWNPSNTGRIAVAQT